MHGVDIILFHSALGLRPGVHRFADRLRRAGHKVHTPDLYDGESFDDIAAGLRKLEAIGGIPALMERTHAAVSDLPDEVVYAGFSNGAGSAELLAGTRPGALGAILMHGALPPDALGMTRWPPTVPVQVHYAAFDPHRTPDAVDALARAVRSSGAAFDLFDYPGSGHLFTDPDLSDYDPASEELLVTRAIGFLSRVPVRV